MVRTVRGKLLLLLGATMLSALVSLALVAWLLQKQVTDVVADRVPVAVSGLEVELEDEVRNVSLVSGVLEQSPHLARLVRENTPDRALRPLQRMRTAFPNADLALYRADGTLFAQIGIARPSTNLATSAPEAIAAARGRSRWQGVVSGGCELDRRADVFAFVQVAPLEDAGFVFVCLPIDRTLVLHAAKNVGVEVAVAVDRTRAVVAATDRFPRALGAHAARARQIETDSDGRRWAFALAEHSRLFGQGTRDSPLDFVVALDVSAVSSRVRQDLLGAAAALVAITLLALWAGSKIASQMSDGITRLGDAMKKLESSQYGHVDGVKTGDEIEDLAVGFNHMVDGLKDRDHLRATFGKYMTQSVMEHLLSGKVQLGGEKLTVTVLFSDIRSFTTISEQMDAHALVELLNEYFTVMVSIIMEEGGVVDKYIGDAIMAVFGAPVSREDDAIRAVRAATRMRAALVPLNESLVARGIAPIATGIGVHTGEVVAGNIGSEQRMEYTVIGDAVNVASRLEGKTKDLGESLVVSETTFALVEKVAKGRALAELSVKGRLQSVRCYAVDAIEAAKPAAE
ncbi:MAG: adenylate/guanylate cyclase domain-containing protein [Myxococcales bacterium]|nr:adenylate/guanylate cyclase domain-containing protein [Myxococcales bacterium]